MTQSGITFRKISTKWCRTCVDPCVPGSAKVASASNFSTSLSNVTARCGHLSSSTGIPLLYFRGVPDPVLGQNSVVSHKLAAASIAPIPLNVLGLVTTISTGYFHSMNDFQPQYANFLPKYFPRYGTMTSDRSSSSCCSDSCHSRSASEFASERVREAVSESSEEGRESRSSSCV